VTNLCLAGVFPRGPFGWFLSCLDHDIPHRQAFLAHHKIFNSRAFSVYHHGGLFNACLSGALSSSVVVQSSGQILQVGAAVEQEFQNYDYVQFRFRTANKNYNSNGMYDRVNLSVPNSTLEVDILQP